MLNFRLRGTPVSGWPTTDLHRDARVVHEVVRESDGVGLIARIDTAEQLLQLIAQPLFLIEHEI